MNTEQLNAMQAAALKRLQDWINRSVGQHLRAMRERDGG